MVAFAQLPAVVYWVDEPAEIEIVDGITVCRIKSGELLIEIRTKPKVLVASLANGTRAFGKFLGQQETPWRLASRWREGAH